MSAWADAARAAISLEDDIELSASESEADIVQDETLMMDEEGFYGEEDRAQLMRLSQLERESILFDRKQKYKEEQDRRAALNRLKQQNQEKKKVVGKREKKGKVSGKDRALESIRERKRNRTVKRTEEYEDDEEEEEEEELESEEIESEDEDYGKRKKKRGREVGKKKARYATESEEEEEYEEEEGEEAVVTKKRAKVPLPVTHTPLTLQSLKNIQMRRTPLEQICSEGFFDQFVKGMFVRIRAGVSRTTNQNIYRIAEIVGVTEYHSKYTLNDGTVTKKVLKLHHPSLEDKEFKILDVSNSGFTQEEMNHWMENMKRANEKIFSAEEAGQRAIDANHYRKTYKYTPEEVERLLRQRQELSGLSMNYTKQIIDLETEIARLKRSGEEEEAKKLSYRLDDIREKDEMQRRKQSNFDMSVATGMLLTRAKPAATTKKADDVAFIAKDQESKTILDSEAVAALEIDPTSLPESFNSLYEGKQIPKELKILAKLHNFDLDIDVMNPPPPKERNTTALFGNRFTVYPYSVKPSHLVSEKPTKSYDFEEYFQAISK